MTESKVRRDNRVRGALFENRMFSAGHRASPLWGGSAARGVSAGTRYGHPASFGRAYGLPVASCSAKRQAMAPTGACARARATSPLSPLSCSHGKRKLRAGTAGAVAGMRDRAGPARTLPAVARGSDLVPRVCCSCGSSS